MSNLFQEFSKTTDQEWIEKISRDLKGKTVAEVAKKRPYDELELRAFYTAENSPPSTFTGERGEWKISSEIAFRESVLADPIHHLVSTGNWLESEDQDMDILSDMVSSNNDYRNLLVNASLYLEAGAGSGFELACTIAHLNEYLNLFSHKKLLSKFTVDRLTINVGTGPDYFMQIAKMRSLRILVKNVVEAYGLENKRFELCAQNSLFNFSSGDADTNILRSTTACMSAIIGGCDSLIIHPHDILKEGGHEFGERIARNIQLMMKHEAHLDKVDDPSSGSYYIENLTRELCKKAWSDFKEIENRGGFIEAFKNGHIQHEIKKVASLRAEAAKDVRDVYIGINKFRTDNESAKQGETLIMSGQYEVLRPVSLEDSIE